MSRSLLIGLLVVSLLLVSGSVFAQVLCPDGSFVARGPCQLCPDGTFIGGSGRCQIAPDGSFVPEGRIPAHQTPSGGFMPERTLFPQIAPDRSFHQGGRQLTLCPDGTFVAGTRCVLAPNGRFVGQ